MFREREKACGNRERGRGQGRERESPADYPLSMEPHIGLRLRTLRS